jgi:hypothetical protein
MHAAIAKTTAAVKSGPLAPALRSRCVTRIISSTHVRIAFSIAILHCRSGRIATMQTAHEQQRKPASRIK